MKFGIICRKNTRSIGEDIQAYAMSCLIPSVDYVIDREHTDDFVSKDKEAVAVIMNGWYMLAKWNWPPSQYIYPYFAGFHYSDYEGENVNDFFIKDDFIEGLGGEYLKKYGPVGCSDKFTEEKLKNKGIEAYFSGCAALTVPEMEDTEDKNKYICLVDISKKLADKIKKDSEKSDIEIREYSHTRENDKNRPFSEIVNSVKEILTIYQNAKCVVTTEFNCSMACLSMGVPVLYIENKEDVYMQSYIDLLNSVTEEDYLQGKCKYDILNPIKNKEDYKKIREEFITSCKEFVEKAKENNSTPEELNKFRYSEIEIKRWRHDAMKKALDEWYIFNKDQQKEIDKVTKKIKKQKIKIEELNEEN